MIILPALLRWLLLGSLLDIVFLLVTLECLVLGSTFILFALKTSVPELMKSALFFGDRLCELGNYCINWFSCMPYPSEYSELFRKFWRSWTFLE